MHSVNAVHARQTFPGPRYPSAPGPNLVPQEIWNISQVTQDDPKVTQNDPRVTQDDPRVTEDDLRVTQDDTQVTPG